MSSPKTRGQTERSREFSALRHTVPLLPVSRASRLLGSLTMARSVGTTESAFLSPIRTATYLQLLDSQCQLSGVSVLGFCLMSNHVHLVLIPHKDEALGLALRYAQGRYAAY